jgi:hypothetical protein
MQCNKIVVYICERKFVALVDTGADRSFMNYDVLALLPSSLRQKFVAKKEMCICANKSKIEILGSIDIPFVFNGTKFRETFMVLPHASNDLFLGLTFLKKYSVTLQFVANSMKISTPIQVQSPCRLSIEPYSEILCRGELAATVPDGTIGLCERPQTNKAQSLLSANSLVTSNSNSIPVRLYNGSSRPLYIRKGSMLTQFPLWEDGETSVQPDWD